MTASSVGVALVGWAAGLTEWRVVTRISLYKGMCVCMYSMCKRGASVCVFTEYLYKIYMHVCALVYVLQKLDFGTYLLLKDDSISLHCD